MTTKYNVGDVVMVPTTVNRITISCKGNVFYDVGKVANSDTAGLSNVSEKDIIGTLNDREIPRELLDKKVDLIKQLREANGFSYEEISMIMNMDESAVREILSDDES